MQNQPQSALRSDRCDLCASSSCNACGSCSHHPFRSRSWCAGSCRDLGQPQRLVRCLLLQRSSILLALLVSGLLPRSSLCGCAPCPCRPFCGCAGSCCDRLFCGCAPCDRLFCSHWPWQRYALMADLPLAAQLAMQAHAEGAKQAVHNA